MMKELFQNTLSPDSIAPLSCDKLSFFSEIQLREQLRKAVLRCQQKSKEMHIHPRVGKDTFSGEKMEYWNHTNSVAVLTQYISSKINPDIIRVHPDIMKIVGYFHDIVEDEYMTTEEVIHFLEEECALYKSFVDQIITGVVSLTKKEIENRDSLTTEEIETQKNQRDREYYNTLKKSSLWIKIVKLADMLHNITTLDGKNGKSALKGAIKYIKSLPQIFSEEEILMFNHLFPSNLEEFTTQLEKYYFDLYRNTPQENIKEDYRKFLETYNSIDISSFGYEAVKSLLRQEIRDEIKQKKFPQISDFLFQKTPLYKVKYEQIEILQDLYRSFHAMDLSHTPFSPEMQWMSKRMIYLERFLEEIGNGEYFLQIKRDQWDNLKIRICFKNQIYLTSSQHDTKKLLHPDDANNKLGENTLDALKKHDALEKILEEALGSNETTPHQKSRIEKNPQKYKEFLRKRGLSINPENLRKGNYSPVRDGPLDRLSYKYQKEEEKGSPFKYGDK